MSVYYYLVCDAHKEQCPACTNRGDGLPLSISTALLGQFIFAHRECTVRIVDEHEGDEELCSYRDWDEAEKDYLPERDPIGEAIDAARLCLQQTDSTAGVRVHIDILSTLADECERLRIGWEPTWRLQEALTKCEEEWDEARAEAEKQKELAEQLRMILISVGRQHGASEITKNRVRLELKDSHDLPPEEWSAYRMRVQRDEALKKLHTATHCDCGVEYSRACPGCDNDE